MKMQGKTVIVTGGGRGIGFGIATAFAREGANIAITNLNEQGLEEAKKALEGYGAQVLTVVADGADERAVASAVKQTADRFGGIDVVVNNAQASKSGVLLVDHTTADFDYAESLVFSPGVVETARAALRRKGSLSRKPPSASSTPTSRTFSTSSPIRSPT